MSKSVKLWCFLLFLPFLAVVGHDLYANYAVNPRLKINLEQLEIDPTAYQSSDLGYLMVTYVPWIYENLKMSVSRDTWEQWVDPILGLYSFVGALVPPSLFFIWLLISAIFDVWPFAGTRKLKAKAKLAPPPHIVKTAAEKREIVSQYKYKRH